MNLKFSGNMELNMINAGENLQKRNENVSMTSRKPREADQSEKEKMQN
jgi:hypothetical protein